MALTSIIKVIKVNEVRSGVKDGRPWSMQDAECILMDENGEEQQVGVLQLPKALMADAAPARGTYIGAFALLAGMRDRRITAVLTALTPYAPSTRVSPKPAAAV
jgi:hypothetical protein